MSLSNSFPRIGRRAMLAQIGGASAVGRRRCRRKCTLGSRGRRVSPAAGQDSNFKFSLNMATIRGQKLSLPAQVDVAAKAGYQAIPNRGSSKELHHYVADGGKGFRLEESEIQDLGLAVPSAHRLRRLDPMMTTLVARPGSSNLESGTPSWSPRDRRHSRMAAPPSGAYNTVLDLNRVSDRYRKLLELSCPLGIVPELEMWGGSKTLSRMSQIAYVLVETGHPAACGLLDVFHIFKGGSDFAGIRIFNGAALHVLHMNDYPALPREKATDADRVFPGEGTAPIVALLRDLRAIGYDGYLSLELFNRGYWKQDALTTVARTGREKDAVISWDNSSSLSGP